MRTDFLSSNINLSFLVNRQLFLRRLYAMEVKIHSNAGRYILSRYRKIYFSKIHSNGCPTVLVKSKVFIKDYITGESRFPFQTFFLLNHKLFRRRLNAMEGNVHSNAAWTYILTRQRKIYFSKIHINVCPLPRPACCFLKVYNIYQRLHDWVWTVQKSFLWQT